MEKNLKMNLSLKSACLYFYQRKLSNPSLTAVTVAADKGTKEEINNISAAQTMTSAAGVSCAVWGGHVLICKFLKRSSTEKTWKHQQCISMTKNVVAVPTSL